jgi:hypothetical protein
VNAEFIFYFLLSPFEFLCALCPPLSASTNHLSPITDHITPNSFFSAPHVLGFLLISAGLMTSPKEVARENVDALLKQCCWADECHRSIYNIWRQVLECFDAHVIRLTNKPSKQTIGFFNKNVVIDWSTSDKILFEGKSRTVRAWGASHRPFRENFPGPHHRSQDTPLVKDHSRADYIRGDRGATNQMINLGPGMLVET